MVAYDAQSVVERTGNGSVLFLCTGNYYRSRFAEELFNHFTQQKGALWKASSRALALERGEFNIGALSPFTLHGLSRRGIIPQAADRLPRQCALTDLEAADHIVALDESEHRPLMQTRFPLWEWRAEYWSVGDVGFVSPEVALAEIEQRVGGLLKNLLGQSR